MTDYRPIKIADVVACNKTSEIFKVMVVRDTELSVYNHNHERHTLALNNVRLATDHDRVLFSQKHPDTCPFCLTSGIEGGFIEISEGKALQESWCGSCGYEWVSEYGLSAISKLNEVA
ncbi:hypothetical protein [Aliidiomarina quisquiliarum]|uniref:hypothetical protein n=1 Tax=Aliidiomarina quisquiliarum TaxID=2938947 RepID=UPI00208FE7D5|nr:hypothetical protein [Aliidiomarina quisquiliarum]MCO4319988.1 hypothetical protein [Aliidiomarina quisquiliarum]